MRIRKLLLASAFALLFAFMYVPLPAAHAFSVPNTATDGVQSANTDTFSLTVANVGDLIVLNVQLDDGGSAGHTNIHVTSVTDGQLNSYILANRTEENFPPNCSAGNCFDDEVWYATSLGTGADSITVNWSQANAAGSNFEAYDVVGITSAVLSFTATNSGGVAGSSFSTAASLAFGSQNFVDSSVFTPCQAAGVYSAGAGYQAVNPIRVNVGVAEYGKASGGPASPTNFPSTCTTTGSWIDVGVIFGPPLSSTIIVQTAPLGIINGVKVNGSFIAGSQTYVEPTGSHLNLTALASALGPAASLYSFSSWSDAGARSHIITVAGSATYTATFVLPNSCNQPTPFKQLQAGCWLPSVVNWYSGSLMGNPNIGNYNGIVLFMGIMVSDVDMALFIKTKSAVIALAFFTLAVTILAAALPGVFSEIAYTVLALGIAGLIYRLFTLRT